MKFNSYEIVDGRKIVVYDSISDNLIDRYTVVFIDTNYNGSFQILGMNEEPLQPLNGFCQVCEGMLGRHLGKPVKFRAIPKECQKAVKRFLKTHQIGKRY